MTLYVAKGVKGANGNQFNIYGYPIPNSASSDYAAANLTAPLSPVNVTYYFDVTGMTENHEIPMVILAESGLNVTSQINVTFSWFRKRDNKLVYRLYGFIDRPTSGSFSSIGYVAWIGWLSDEGNGVSTYPTYCEIQENGDYFCNVIASGGYTFDGSIDFSVFGITPKTVLEKTSDGSFNWTVRLSNYFRSSNYIQSGICTQPFTDGQSTAPNGIIGYVNAPASNSGAAASGTVSDLASGNYTIYGFARAANGLYYNVGYPISYTSTYGVPTEIPTVSGYVGASRFIYVSWTPTANTTGYLVYKNSGSGDYLVTGTTSTSVQIQVDYEYTDYRIRIVPYNSYGNAAVGGVGDFKTMDETVPIMDSFYATAISTSQISVYAKGHDPIPQVGGKASGVSYINFYLNGSWVSSMPVNASGEAYYTFTNLNPNTQYTLLARAQDKSNNLSGTVTISITTSSGRPSNFSWTNSKTSGQSFILSAEEWNEFTQRISDFRTYKSLSAYSFTTAVVGSDVTSAIFNQAVAAISQMSPSIPTPSTVAYRDDITAKILNDIVASLNSIP